MSKELLCGLQVLISHSETKDGSGGPDYEDLEPGDPVELERTFTEPTEHQSVIVVRQCYQCGSAPTQAGVNVKTSRPPDHLHLYVNHAELE